MGMRNKADAIARATVEEAPRKDKNVEFTPLLVGDRAQGSACGAFQKMKYGKCKACCKQPGKVCIQPRAAARALPTQRPSWSRTIKIR
eukprot:scaffold282360_cov32-Tisochrysis_lutea.AAC.2